jgi:hypothetical protein
VRRLAQAGILRAGQASDVIGFFKGLHVEPLPLER